MAGYGAWLEQSGRTAEAAQIYERGIQQDNLAESLYRGLMRCHLAAGQASEAIRVYRRLRELLSVVLSVSPDAQTEALYRQAYGT